MYRTAPRLALPAATKSQRTVELTEPPVQLERETTRPRRADQRALISIDAVHPA